ncbi:uncharacterized protein LOC110866675 [Helianthus annuus]|uniref:uncharacterized protein LOC110866675 n=1 Tax=Helianthus annuus TaxID=4232 RepID=UPI000B900B8C|nr:uncharacterized protein LOC110866675 [Helianthus annuus]
MDSALILIVKGVARRFTLLRIVGVKFSRSRTRGNGGYGHQNQNSNNKNNSKGNGGGAKGRTFTLGKGEARNDSNVVIGKSRLNNHFANVLFDSGVVRSFMSESFRKLLDVTHVSLENKYTTELADGKPAVLTHTLNVCRLSLAGHAFEIDLMPTTLGSFDVVTIRIPLSSGETLSIQGDRSGVVTDIISFMQAHKYLRKKNSVAIFTLITEQSTGEKKADDFPIVRDFPDVFPEDLPGRPPHRHVEFEIQLANNAALIARAPYRLAPFELQELSTQLQELLDKGFVTVPDPTLGAEAVNQSDDLGVYSIRSI